MENVNLKYCPQCGTQAPSTANFCLHCGSAFPRSASPSLSSSQSPLDTSSWHSLEAQSSRERQITAIEGDLKRIHTYDALTKYIKEFNYRSDPNFEAKHDYYTQHFLVFCHSYYRRSILDEQCRFQRTDLGIVLVDQSGWSTIETYPILITLYEGNGEIVGIACESCGTRGLYKMTYESNRKRSVFDSCEKYHYPTEEKEKFPSGKIRIDEYFFKDNKLFVVIRDSNDTYGYRGDKLSTLKFWLTPLTPEKFQSYSEKWTIRELAEKYPHAILAMFLEGSGLQSELYHRPSITHMRLLN